MINVGKNISTRRKESNLTQEQLAEKLDIQVVTVGRWERGEREPNIEMLDKLSDTLEITMDHLIYGESMGYDSGEEMIGELELAIMLHEKAYLEVSTKPENITYEKGVLDGLKKALDIIYEMQI